MSVCCPCGGFTVARIAKEKDAILNYEECGSCGRCGDYRLLIAGEVVAKEQTARRLFQDANAIDTVRERLKQQRGNK